MVLALLRRQLVTPARAARTAQLCRPLACRHATAVRSLCTSSEADGDGETAAVLPSIKRSELTEPTKKRVAYQQRYACAGCDILLPPTYEVDHIIPLALGGTNGLRNLQALCVPCHAQKTRDQRHAILATRKPPPPPQQPTTDGEAGAVLGAASEGSAEEEERLAAVGSSEAQEGARDVRGESSDASLAAARRRPSSSSSSSLSSSSSSQLLSPLQLLRGMNRQQLAAVLATRGPVRLSAGPGTGKTRVLVAHIAHLVGAEQVPPRRVLALTFTNKAARELRERLTGVLGPAAADAMTLGTFHSLCLAMLRRDIAKLQPELPYRPGFAMYDADDAVKVVREVMAEMGVIPPKQAAGTAKGQVQARGWTPGQVQSAISAAKNSNVTAASYGRLRGASPVVAATFVRYEAAMRARNAVDFDDLLLLSAALLQRDAACLAKYQQTWSHLLVDEFQVPAAPAPDQIQAQSHDPGPSSDADPDPDTYPNPIPTLTGPGVGLVRPAAGHQRAAVRAAAAARRQAP